MEDLNKIILVDADGVLLNWAFGFDRWVKNKGYVSKNNSYNIGEKYEIHDRVASELIKTFNETAACGYLQPFRDSVKYVRKLHDEHGYMFHVISSFSSDKLAQKLRITNLKRHFGEGIFIGYDFLDIGASKLECLKKFENTGYYWIDDLSVNCDDGDKCGLTSVLMKHYHNERDATRIHECYNWKEFYNDYI